MISTDNVCQMLDDCLWEVDEALERIDYCIARSRTKEARVRLCHLAALVETVYDDTVQDDHDEHIEYGTPRPRRGGGYRGYDAPYTT